MSASSLERLFSLYLASRSVSTDTRKIKAGDLFFALRGANFNGNRFAAKALEAGAAYAIIDDPEFYDPEDARYILVEDVLLSLQHLSRQYRRHLQLPILGITGSNGKTTSKELIASVLSQRYRIFATPGNFNNHIGVPLSLLQIPQDTEIAIIEMGANQPGDIAELADIAEPTHALITNVGWAHIEKLGSLEGVAKTKGALFEFVRAHGGFAFVNDADHRVKALGEGIPQISFGTPDSEVYGTILQNTLYQMETQIEAPAWGISAPFTSRISGNYNAMNILAAVTIGWKFGLTLDELQQGIYAYLPQNQRSQVLEKAGKKIWLDAYNANPSSMKASIQNFFQLTPQHPVLIIGDMYELGEESKSAHKELGEIINVLKPALTIGVGQEIQHTLAMIEGATLHFEQASDAIPELKSVLAPADMILIKGSRGVALEKVLAIWDQA